MDPLFLVIVGCIAIVLFDVFAVVFGADSRDGVDAPATGLTI